MLTAQKEEHTFVNAMRKFSNNTKTARITYSTHPNPLYTHAPDLTRMYTHTHTHAAPHPCVQFEWQG